MSVWVMPSVDVYENFLKRSQAVAGGGHPQLHQNRKATTRQSEACQWDSKNNMLILFAIQSTAKKKTHGFICSTYDHPRRCSCASSRRFGVMRAYDTYMHTSS